MDKTADLLAFACFMLIRDMNHNLRKEWWHMDSSSTWRKQEIAFAGNTDVSQACSLNAEKEWGTACRYRQSHMEACAAFLDAIGEEEFAISYEGESYEVTRNGCELIEGDE